MTLPPLKHVAELAQSTGTIIYIISTLAGYPLPEADLTQVASILEGMMEDIQRLRDLDVPDDVEPILSFHVDPWEA